MHTLLQDIRYGIRMLLQRPGFTIAAILSLALGIGANSTIFSWVNGILMNPMPGVEEPERLVALQGIGRTGDEISFSYLDYKDLNERNDTFEGIIIHDNRALSLSTGDDSERIFGVIVSGNYFDVLGVKPILGRGFLPEENETLSTHPVVVISYALWQNRFDGDPAIIGRTVKLNTYPFTVIGVTPETFHGNETALSFDAWVPMMMQKEVVGQSNRLERRGSHWLDAIGRLKPGVSIGQAQAQLNTISSQLDAEYPNEHAEQRINLFYLWESPQGATKVMGPVLLILMGVVGMVLLIACANVANLLLARAAGRRREMAIRNALGASRGRIIRQLLTESIILAMVAGLCGIAMAYWSEDLLMAFIPPVEFNVHLTLGLNASVLGFTLLISLFTGIIFGIAPAWQASRHDVAPALKDETGTVAGGKQKTRLRNGLVVGQIALSLILLITSGLFLQSLRQIQTFKPGFDPDNVLLASIDLFPNGYTPDNGRQLFAQLYDRVETLPGVESVTYGRRVPLGLGGSSSTSIEVEGYTPEPDMGPWSFYNQIGPKYFESMKIPLIQGRDFTRQDTQETQAVAIINEELANRYWANRDPMGQRFRFNGTWVTVVGIVQNTKYHEFNESPRPYMFFPVLQSYRPGTNLQIRTNVPPTSLATAIRNEVRALDPNLPVFNIRTLEEHMSGASIGQRIGGILLGIFGSLALILAAVGVSGMLAYVVSQQTHEIGIRLALGAGNKDILWMVLQQGGLLVGLGMAIGLAISFGTTRLMSSLLFGVSATDPMVFIGITVLLGVVGMIACYIPAYRASRVDPMVALRYE